jgi:urea transport system permease protein
MLRPMTQAVPDRCSGRRWHAFAGVGVAVPLAHAGCCRQPIALRRVELRVTLLGKFMCYAMVAIAMDLIWGYTGILSLGQSLFFALGGYAFGMYLMRGIGREGQYQSDLPDFMVFLDWKTLPWYWWNSDSFLWSVFLVVAVPGLLAFVFGFFAFRSRIKGVYFSIITQALTFAFMLLFFRNETGFGGNNGFTDFKTHPRFPVTASTKPAAACDRGRAVRHLRARALARHRKFGRVLTAIRDAGVAADVLRLRPAHTSSFVWTLAAVISGLRARSTCRRSASSTRAR